LSNTTGPSALSMTELSNGDVDRSEYIFELAMLMKSTDDINTFSASIIELDWIDTEPVACIVIEASLPYTGSV
jgi:hypothetical protein